MTSGSYLQTRPCTASTATTRTRALASSCDRRSGLLALVSSPLDLRERCGRARSSGEGRSPLQCDFPERCDKRSLELGLHAQKDFVSLFPRHGRLVGARLDQRGEDVGNGQYSYDIRYALGTKPVGIAAAVQVLVMMADGIENFRGNACGPLQYFIPRCRMGFDQRAFPVVKAPGLVQNGERNSCLPDVVKHRR